jgi:hypothetical protein
MKNDIYVIKFVTSSLKISNDITKTENKKWTEQQRITAHWQ